MKARTLWLSISLFVAGICAHQQIFDQITEDFELRRYVVDDVQKTLKLSKDLDLDVWQLAPSHMDVRVSTKSQPLNSPYTAIPLPPPDPNIPDPGPLDLSTLTNNTFHAAYHPLEEITSFIHQLAKEYPSMVQIFSIGSSSEGRDMLGIKIQAPIKKPKHHKRKPGFVIQGAQHAREWVATATALYLAHSLVAPKSDANSNIDLLNVFDFHIIPVPNPDGYEYTWKTDRFFYKNRQPVGRGGRCIGIDMNRNWGYKWLPQNEESDPCSHWYPGSHAFEAPEVNNIASYVTYRATNLYAFLDLRAYGQMLSTPYSYSCNVLPGNAENLMEAALGAVQAHHKVHGTPLSTGRLCEQLYSAPGNVVDWMYASAGIKYSYVTHLRDTGTYGYSLPSRFIQPVGEEMSALLTYIINFINKHHKF